MMLRPGFEPGCPPFRHIPDDKDLGVLLGVTFITSIESPK